MFEWNKYQMAVVIPETHTAFTQDEQWSIEQARYENYWISRANICAADAVNQSKDPAAHKHTHTFCVLEKCGPP